MLWKLSSEPGERTLFFGLRTRHIQGRSETSKRETSVFLFFIERFFLPTFHNNAEVTLKKKKCFSLERALTPF